MSGEVVMPRDTRVHTFDSALLAGNPLGDPATRRVPVYLPPGYDDAGAEDAYPVLFALAGFTGTGLSYLAYDWYQEALPDRLDRLIGSGAMRPVVVVMVDGMTKIGGNQYIDSGAVGPWARHVVDELVPWAESTFRLKPGREHRGVFGKSSGGYGALMMALEHADTFGAAVSHSGDCYFDYCYGVDFPRAVDGLRAEGGLGAFLEKVKTRHWPKMPGHLFPTLNIVAMSHFYSPDPDAEHGFLLPMDEGTGERDPEVLAMWRRRDPVELVETHTDALRQMALLWVECGTQDQFHLHHGARILARRLTDHGVPHVHREFEDDHRSLNYRYDVTLPPLSRAVWGEDPGT